MAQIPKGELVKGPSKPICRDCAIYFSTTVTFFLKRYSTGCLRFYIRVLLLQILIKALLSLKSEYFLSHSRLVAAKLFFSIGFVRVDNQRCFFTWAMNIMLILLGKIDLDYNDYKTLSGWVGGLRNWLLCFWQVYHPHQSRSTCLPLNSIWMFIAKIVEFETIYNIQEISNRTHWTDP